MGIYSMSFRTCWGAEKTKQADLRKKHLHVIHFDSHVKVSSPALLQKAIAANGFWSCKKSLLSFGAFCKIAFHLSQVDIDRKLIVSIRLLLLETCKKPVKVY